MLNLKYTVQNNIDLASHLLVQTRVWALTCCMNLILLAPFFYLYFFFLFVALETLAGCHFSQKEPKVPAQHIKEEE